MSSDLEKKKEKRAEDNSKKAMEDKETCGDYLIMDVVGRGAFGVVYRAVHRNKGNWVAIKRVILNRKKKMQLTSLMMEIDLLKSLEHPNIVQYIDHVCSEDYLSIIMEYIENGSLESVLRKHGKFPETLVATYMAQVVEGLNYLHDQGVIHRDIKGANILITTAGKAKLADFGVSTKLSDISNPEDSFAGTPYWMAPEIITMSGATTACDIWSVGCTIIELLTGIPPYGNLPAAASLYRIVQDDHPPIPEGITPALQDLLLQCFKKDVNMRITAANLLHHPWLTKAQDSSDFNVVEKQIQQYKKALDRDTKSSPSASPKASRRISKEATAFTHKRGKENGTAPSNPNNNNSINNKSGGSSMGWVARLTRSRSTLNETGTVELISHSPTSPPQIARAERNNGSNKNSKKSTPPFVGEEEEEEEGDEDYDSDENFSEIELSKTVKLRRKTGRAQPQDLDIGSKSLDSFKTIKKQGLDLVLSRQASSPLVLRTPNPEDVVMELDIGDSDSDSETLTSVPDGKTRDTATSGFPSILRTGLGKFVEIEESSTDDFLDGIELEENGVLELHDPGKHFLSSPTASTGGSASTSSNEFDAFNNIIEGDEEDKEALLRVRQLEQLKIDVVGWIQLLSSSQPESVVLQACENLVNAFRTQPKKKKHLISNTAIIQLLNMMDVVAAKNQWKLLQAILQVINEMLSSKLRRRAGNQAGVKQVKSRDNPLQTNFCLLGGIPAVTKFAAAHYPKHIRLEAARFITQMSHSNPLALHMFIACGGLSVLVTLLEPNYHAYRTLVCSTINCIWSIFHLQILPKNDFCHLFTKCGLLERLSIALTNVHKDSSVRDTLYKVSDVFFYFSQASLDSGVQKSMCEPHVLTHIKHVLEQPVEPSYHVLWLLHTIRNLLVHAEARPFLEKHSFAEILIRYLERREEFTKEEIARCCPRKDSKGSLEEKENVTLNKIHNQVLNALFLFCQLDHRRQERAAMAGIIPSLIYFIEVGRVHFLKELAITVFLDLPHASSKVRELLWRCDSFPVFTRLLKNSSWFVEVLQCLLRWRRSEPEKMNLELEKSADKLVGCFSFYNKPSFVKAVEPILTIVQECPPVNLAMSEAGVIPKIIEALEKETNAHVRASLLKIVHSLLEHHPNPRGVAHQTGLLNAVKEIYRTDQRVFVQNICGRLLALKQLQDRKNPTTYQHKKVMKQLRSNRNSAS